MNVDEAYKAFLAEHHSDDDAKLSVAFRAGWQAAHGAELSSQLATARRLLDDLMFHDLSGQVATFLGYKEPE